MTCIYGLSTGNNVVLQVARDVGSKVEKAEKPEVPKFVVDRYTANPIHPDCLT